MKTAIGIGSTILGIFASVLGMGLTATGVFAGIGVPMMLGGAAWATFSIIACGYAMGVFEPMSKASSGTTTPEENSRNDRNHTKRKDSAIVIKTLTQAPPKQQPQQNQSSAADTSNSSRFTETLQSGISSIMANLSCLFSPLSGASSSGSSAVQPSQTGQKDITPKS
jgi:hypothetical protein